MLRDKTILITGGTGSFGNNFVPMTLEKHNPARIVIFSRDEMKQWEMAKKYSMEDRNVLSSAMSVIRIDYVVLLTVLTL